MSAVAITRVMAGLLDEIRPTDAVAFLGSVVLLAGVAVMARLIPAWGATRVDPLVALRWRCTFSVAERGRRGVEMRA